MVIRVAARGGRRAASSRRRVARRRRSARSDGKSAGLGMWAGGRPVTGDRAELAWEPSEAAWAQVSTGLAGSARARRAALRGGVLCGGRPIGAPEGRCGHVNTHLYATSLAIGGDLLPPTTWSCSTRPTSSRTSLLAALGFDLGPGAWSVGALGPAPSLDRRLLGRAGGRRAASASTCALATPRLSLQRPIDGRARWRSARERASRPAGGASPGMRSCDGEPRQQTRPAPESQQAAGHLIRDIRPDSGAARVARRLGGGLRPRAGAAGGTDRGRRRPHERSGTKRTRRPPS